MPEAKQATFIINAEVLKKQVGIYAINEEDVRYRAMDKNNLHEACINKFYDGIKDYRESKDTKIDELIKNHPNLDINTLSQKNFVGQNEHIFRTALIQFIKNKENELPVFKREDSDIRAKEPEKETIKLEKLLGKDGVALYKAALEEEANSEAFRNAVFYNSTKYYDGKYSTGNKPVIIVGGPSGSGKSFAADAVVEKTLADRKSNGENQEGIYFVTADGGIVREVSQMRKLMIRIANAQGYTGVKDLHSQSKVLESTKKCVREAALESETLGVVIPETFSDWKPGRIPNKKKNMMDKLIQRDNTELIFTRVTARKIGLFRKIVQFMGSRRAWKTDFPESGTPQINDLNSTENLAESKAYGAKGFLPGLLGSKLAEKWFLKQKGNPSSYLITNDLMFVKKDGDRWGEVKENDEGVKIVSKRAWDQYQSNTNVDLFKYAREIQPQITTPMEKDLLVCIEDITKYLGDAENDKIRERSEANKIALIKTREILIGNLEMLDGNIPSEKKDSIETIIDKFKNDRSFSTTRKFLKRVLPSRMQKLFSFFTPSRTRKLLNKSKKAIIASQPPKPKQDVNNHISNDQKDETTENEKTTKSFSQAMAPITKTARVDTKVKAEYSRQKDETVDNETVAEKASSNDKPEEEQAAEPPEMASPTTRPRGP